MDGIVTSAGSVVDAAGYAGLALVMLAETLLPIPSEVVLPLVGLQITAGQMRFWAAALAATVGSVLGAWMLYVLGRFGGRPMALRLPRSLGITEKRLARTESWFSRRGDLIVLVGRLVPGVRCLVSIPAGTLRMPVRRFLVLTTLGSLAWNSALLGLGMWLADRWETVLSAVSSATPYAMAAIAVGGLLVLVRRRTRRSWPGRDGATPNAAGNRRHGGGGGRGWLPEPLRASRAASATAERATRP
jgi:membrane protein DedA with SNARE-associated domain